MVDIASHLSRAARPRRLICAAAVAAATLSTLLSASPGALAARTDTCANATTPIARSTPDQMRNAVLCLINRERAESHLPGLVASHKLDRSAQDWTNTMVGSDEFSHGNAFMDRISAVGFDWTTVGENIATGYATPQSVVNGWMASPGHCANILDPAYREVGTGVSADRIRGASPLHGVWTQDFGRLMDQPALSGNTGPAEACYSH